MVAFWEGVFSADRIILLDGDGLKFTAVSNGGGGVSIFTRWLIKCRAIWFDVDGNLVVCLCRVFEIDSAGSWTKFSRCDMSCALSVGTLGFIIEYGIGPAGIWFCWAGILIIEDLKIRWK